MRHKESNLKKFGSKPHANKTDIIATSMASWFSSNTYHLHQPFRAPVVRGFLIFFVFNFLLIAILQWVGQSTLSVSLPPPSLDSRNPEFNAKLNYLNAFFRQYGKIDCVLVGSSQVDTGLNPAVIDQIYLTETRQEIHCFNFGISSLTTDSAAPVVMMLMKMYHPRLLVFEVSARSFDKRFGDLARPLIENPWIRYQSGDRTPEGWALDNFYAYRYYRTFKFWQNPYSRNIMFSNWQKMNHLGFSPVYNQKPPESDDPINIDFQIQRSNWQGFQDVLALSDQTHLIVIEAPVRESYLPVYLKGGLDAYQTKFIQPIQAELSAHGVPFWRAQLEVAHQIPEEMWFDDRHVNIQGSVLLSTWLGQKIAQEVSPELFR